MNGAEMFIEERGQPCPQPFPTGETIEYGSEFSRRSKQRPFFQTSSPVWAGCGRGRPRSLAGDAGPVRSCRGNMSDIFSSSRAWSNLGRGLCGGGSCGRPGESGGQPVKENIDDRGGVEREDLA